MNNAFLLRTPDRRNAIILLRDTRAVVQIELQSPLSNDDFAKAQCVHAMAPLQVYVDLGPYDMDRFRFTNCTMATEFTAVSHERLDYLERRRKRKE